MRIQQVSPQETLPIRQQVLWPDHPIDFCRIPEDDAAVHLGAFHQQELICVGSLYSTAQGARLRKFATLPTHQGRGVGSAVLTAILELAQQRGDAQMWLDARQEAMGLYQRFGFEPKGAVFFKHDRPYRRMSKRF